MPRVPDLNLPTNSARVQAQNKDAWNGERSRELADFYTIGYMRRDIASFVSVLRDAGVMTVLDVRYAPVSIYKPDFSKTNLRRHLAEAEIGYLHFPELGVPRDIRGKAAGQPTRDLIWHWYDRHVVPLLTLHSFFNSSEHPVALLCVELDPTSCHRHRLSLALERRGLRGFDL